MLKVSGTRMNVDKVLAIFKTVTAIQVTLPKSGELATKTMLMPRHQKIAGLFGDLFWGTH